MACIGLAHQCSRGRPRHLPQTHCNMFNTTGFNVSKIRLLKQINQNFPALNIITLINISDFASSELWVPTKPRNRVTSCSSENSRGFAHDSEDNLKYHIGPYLVIKNNHEMWSGKVMI